MYPLSFSEFMSCYDGNKYDGWNEYITYGGIPLVVLAETDEQKMNLLDNLFQETYISDIVKRNKIRNVGEMESLLDVLASAIGALTNPNKLQKTFKSVNNSKITATTITKYIEYLEDSFLIEEANRYDIKGKSYIGTPLKYYFMDMGLRNSRIHYRQLEVTHSMENVIYNELRMRGFHVDVGNLTVVEKGKDTKPVKKQLEVDFICNKGSKKYALYGQEAIGSTWALAKMNMFLHSEDNHRIEWGDTIRNPKLLDNNGGLLHFDVVTANPPFSLDKWGFEDAENDHFGRFHRAVPPKTKGDYAFISHMIETLKPETGRMGVVVPHGVLFRGSSEGTIRQKLIEENLLDAVIGLPSNLFFGTGIPAAILIFKKQKIDNNVLFIDASREYKSGKNQNQLTEENIQKIVDTYRNGENVEKYAYLASLEEIRENDYNLNIPRYVDTFEEEAEIDLMAVREERLALQTELAALEAEMEGYLKELGYGA